MISITYHNVTRYSASTYKVNSRRKFPCHNNRLACPMAAGVGDVVFPFGTWSMRVVHSALRLPARSRKSHRSGEVYLTAMTSIAGSLQVRKLYAMRISTLPIFLPELWWATAAGIAAMPTNSVGSITGVMSPRLTAPRKRKPCKKADFK